MAASKITEVGDKDTYVCSRWYDGQHWYQAESWVLQSEHIHLQETAERPE